MYYINHNLNASNNTNNNKIKIDLLYYINISIQITISIYNNFNKTLPDLNSIFIMTTEFCNYFRLQNNNTKIKNESDEIYNKINLELEKLKNDTSINEKFDELKNMIQLINKTVKGSIWCPIDNKNLDNAYLEKNTYRYNINPNMFLGNNKVKISLQEFSCFNNQYNINKIDNICIECENLTKNIFSDRKILNVVNIETFSKNSTNEFNQKFILQQKNIIELDLDNKITNELIIKISDLNGNPLDISNLDPHFIFRLDVY